MFRLLFDSKSKKVRKNLIRGLDYFVLNETAWIFLKEKYACDHEIIIQEGEIKGKNQIITQYFIESFSNLLNVDAEYFTLGQQTNPNT